jgi:hypothetical protein
VDDPALVRGGEPPRDLDGVLDGLARGEPADTDLRAERVALQPLRDDVRQRLVRAHVVDGEDVRVVERARGPRLLLEAAETVRTARRRLRQHLDGDLTAEPRVPRAVDLAHAAGPEGPADLVHADARSRLQSHVLEVPGPQL